MDGFLFNSMLPLRRRGRLRRGGARDGWGGRGDGRTETGSGRALPKAEVEPIGIEEQRVRVLQVLRSREIGGLPGDRCAPGAEEEVLPDDVPAAGAHEVDALAVAA